MLDTVNDYVAFARELLQDEVASPYRYSDVSLVRSLSGAFPEAKKLRPDLFITTPLQTFTVNDATAVTFDPMYRMALVYYMAGIIQLRDDEEVTDQRAAAFLSLFASKLTTAS